MAVYILKPDGQPEPETGVRIFSSEDASLWVNHDNDKTYGYQELSELDAYLYGLERRPGTLLAEEVDEINSFVLETYGQDLNDLYFGDYSVYYFLRNMTSSIEPGHPERREPFDIRRWRTPA